MSSVAKKEVQMMRRSIRKIPFPAVGYVFILLGFVGLGLFVAALALDSKWAPALGFATVSAYGAGTACFLIRRWQIAHTHPTATVLPGFDPIRGNTDRRAEPRYLKTYRGGTDDVARRQHRALPVRLWPNEKAVHVVVAQPAPEVGSWSR
jgi:hypothetical protein